MAGLTSQISSSLINDFEFGYAHNAIIIGAQGSADPGFECANLMRLWRPRGSGGKTKGGIRPCGRLAALRQLLVDLGHRGIQQRYEPVTLSRIT